MWNHAQSMIEPVTKELGAWPQFTGAEMNDLVAYVNGAPSAAIQEDGSLRGSADHGWEVFQAKCIQCHSVRGKGGKIGPELGPAHELPRTSAQFAAVLWNHAPAMLQHAREARLAAPTLQGEEITDVLRFLASLRYFEPTGSPFLGERVFAERGCASCHGPSAEGTRNGPKLRAGGRRLHHGLFRDGAVEPRAGDEHARREARHRVAQPGAGRCRRVDQLPERSGAEEINGGRLVRAWHR